jgi:hypothetical protein
MKFCFVRGRIVVGVGFFGNGNKVAAPILEKKASTPDMVKNMDIF